MVHYMEVPGNDHSNLQLNVCEAAKTNSLTVHRSRGDRAPVHPDAPRVEGVPHL